MGLTGFDGVCAVSWRAREATDVIGAKPQTPMIRCLLKPKRPEPESGHSVTRRPAGSNPGAHSLAGVTRFGV